MAMIVMSKGLAVASPWFLKTIVDSMTVTSQLSFGTACLGIGAFCGARFMSELTNNVRMYMIQDMITRGVRKLSFDSFKHLHSLDMNFHKTSSKNKQQNQNFAAIDESLLSSRDTSPKRHHG